MTVLELPAPELITLAPARRLAMPRPVLPPAPALVQHADEKHADGQGTWGLHRCHLVDLPRIQDPRGNLTFVEGGSHVDFDIRRVYYLYDVPGGSERGGHALKDTRQLIVAISGSFDIVLNDGREKHRFHLNRSYQGLYVCPMIWRELDNFSSGSVCMVLASTRYDEDDYYRDYPAFMRARWS